MVKLATAATVAGAWFIVWQLWSMRRKSASTGNFEFATAHPRSELASPADVFAAQREANGAPGRLLSVPAFSAANLEVRANTSRRGRRTSARCVAGGVRRSGHRRIGSPIPHVHLATLSAHSISLQGRPAPRNV